MTEIRPGDVLRLFFGKQYKHFLVNKVSEDTLLLLTETSTETLVHKEGVLSRLGDQVITGFEVVRNQDLYKEYTVGAYVKVALTDGSSVVGDVAANDDGLLTVHTTLGDTIYVDLANYGDAVKNVSLVESLKDNDSFNLQDLPDWMLELQVAYGAADDRRLAWRLGVERNAYLKTTPRWLVPIGDKALVEKKRSQGSITFEVKKGVLSEEPLQVLFLNGKKAAVQVMQGRIPLLNYASLSNLAPLSRLFLPATPLLERIRLHQGRAALFREVHRKSAKAERFKTVSEAVRKAKKPNGPFASEYAAVAALEPFGVYTSPPLGSVHSKPHYPTEITAFARVLPNQRHQFAKQYGRFVNPLLGTTETLLGVLALDYGRRYVDKTSEPLDALFRIRLGPSWNLERSYQKLKKKKTGVLPYDDQFVALLNQIAACLPPDTPAKAAMGRTLFFKYAREPLEGEDPAWLYHIATSEKLAPRSVERMVMASSTRGKTGYAAFLTAQGAIDPSSGFVFSPEETPSLVADVSEVSNVENDPIRQSDLLLFNFAQSLGCSLGFRGQDAYAFALVRNSWKGFDPVRAALGVAGFLAHKSGRNSGEVAEKCRELVQKRRDLGLYSGLASLSNLANLVADEAEAAARVERPTTAPLCRAVEVPQPPCHAAPRATRFHYQAPPEPRAPKRVEQSLPTLPPLLPSPEAKQIDEAVRKKALLRYPALERVLRCTDAVQLYDLVRRLVVLPNSLGREGPASKVPLFPGATKEQTAFAKKGRKTWDDKEEVARFQKAFQTHKKQFGAIAEAAQTARRKGDVKTLQSCVVNAVYLYFEADYGKEIIQHDEAFVASLVDAAFSVALKTAPDVS